MAYRVSADIRYLDGPLAGLTIPDGYALGCPDLSHATRIVAWLIRVRTANDFIRAAVTGNRYQVSGEVRMADIADLVEG